MGITVHYELLLSEDPSTRVATVLRSIADSARKLRFVATGELIHLVGPACDVDKCPDPALAWLLIQAKRRVGEIAEVPLELHALTTCPGEGCEPANIGFARFASVAGWHWTSFCKTQGAAETKLGGIAHFVSCHTRLCKWLRSIEAAGVEVRVHDEGGYWGVWDAGALARNMQAADVAGALFTGTLPPLPRTKKRPPAAAAPPSPAPRYRHPKWGEGTLVSRDGEKLRLRFADESERTLLAASVEILE